MSEPGPPSRLRLYFAVPSTEGFSPYRTGVGLHVALSIVEGGAAYAAVTMLLGGAWWAGFAAALFAVVALWGVGWKLGVASHYVGLMLIPGLALVGITLALPYLGKPGLVAAAAGLVAHVVASIVLKIFAPR